MIQTVEAPYQVTFDQSIHGDCLEQYFGHIYSGFQMRATCQ